MPPKKRKVVEEVIGSSPRKSKRANKGSMMNSAIRSLIGDTADDDEMETFDDANTTTNTSVFPIISESTVRYVRNNI